MLARKFRQEQSASIGHIRLSSLSMTGVPRIFFPPASASIPPRTFAAWPPKQTSAVTAEGGSGYAYTIDAHPAHTASHVDRSDDAAPLMKWRDCHCLCRCGDSQGKRSNGDQSNHSFSPFGDRTNSLLRVELSPMLIVKDGCAVPSQLTKLRYEASVSISSSGSLLATRGMGNAAEA